MSKPQKVSEDIVTATDSMAVDAKPCVKGHCCPKIFPTKTLHKKPHSQSDSSSVRQVDKQVKKIKKEGKQRGKRRKKKPILQLGS